MPRGVTPIAATHRIDFEYTTGTLLHKVQLRCTAILVAGVYHLVNQSGSTIVALTAANYAGTKIATILPSTCAWGAYTLYQYVSGVYNPLESAAMTVTPSALTDTEPTGQWTLKMRDISFAPVNFVILGAAYAAPQHANPNAIGGVTLALAQDLINAADGHIGSWLQGRAGLPMHSFGLYTVSLNRKSRRRLGLA
jgi:hypothetical protein